MKEYGTERSRKQPEIPTGILIHLILILIGESLHLKGCNFSSRLTERLDMTANNFVRSAKPETSENQDERMALKVESDAL